MSCIDFASREVSPNGDVALNVDSNKLSLVVKEAKGYPGFWIIYSLEKGKTYTISLQGKHTTKSKLHLWIAPKGQSAGKNCLFKGITLPGKVLQKYKHVGSTGTFRIGILIKNPQKMGGFTISNMKIEEVVVKKIDKEVEAKKAVPEPQKKPNVDPLTLKEVANRVWKKGDPVVSIIITAYKDRGFLTRAIISAKKQSFSSVEVILSSDGDAKLAAIAKKNKIRFVCLPKRSGLGATLNNGVRISRGKYIKILPDDDELPVNSIKDLVTALEKQKADFIFANSREIKRNRAHRMTGGWGLCAKIRKPINIKPDFKYLWSRNVIHGGTTMYKKDMFVKVGGFDEDLHAAEEFEFHLRLLKLKYKIGYVNRVVFHYRIHNEQKSRGTVARTAASQKKRKQEKLKLRARIKAIKV